MQSGGQSAPSELVPATLLLTEKVAQDNCPSNKGLSGNGEHFFVVTNWHLLIVPYFPQFWQLQYAVDRGTAGAGGTAILAVGPTGVSPIVFTRYHARTRSLNRLEARATLALAS